MGETIKKVLTVICSIILWCVILVAALFAFTTLATKDPNKVNSIFGYTPLSVLTDSMKPTFSAGDLIIIKKCDTSKLEEGDIISFHTIIENTYALNTHRIESINDNGSFRTFVTKGDNNSIADSDEVADSEVVGKFVCKVPVIGRILEFLKKPAGFLICIVIPMLIFFIYQVYNLVMIGIKLKKAEALEAAEEAARIQSQQQSQSDETERLKAELEEAKRKLAQAQAQQKDE